MGFWDFLGSSGGNTTTTGGSDWLSGGNIFGALLTGAQIYNNYQSQQQSNKQNSFNNDLNLQKLAEDKRQFDLAQQLREAQLASQEGIAAGQNEVALKAAQSRAYQGAYQSLIEAVQNGRHNEANALARIAEQIRLVNQGVIR